MEVFRPLDGLATAVADASPPLDQWRKFVYCESLTGRVFGEVDHFKVRQCIMMLSINTATALGNMGLPCNLGTADALLFCYFAKASPLLSTILRSLYVQPGEPF